MFSLSESSSKWLTFETEFLFSNRINSSVKVGLWLFSCRVTLPYATISKIAPDHSMHCRKTSNFLFPFEKFKFFRCWSEDNLRGDKLIHLITVVFLKKYHHWKLQSTDKPITSDFFFYLSNLDRFIDQIGFFQPTFYNIDFIFILMHRSRSQTNTYRSFQTPLVLFPNKCL